MGLRIAVVGFLLVLISRGAAAQGWTPPLTPWGDPDLQGNYSNKYEQGTPFERPAEFAGRRIEEISGTELERLVQERAVEVLLNSPFSGGDPVAGNFGGAPAFYDRFEAARGSRPWLVVDPPDGQVPAMTPDGQRASAARAAARAAARRGRGPADSYTDRSLYDRCITRGLPGSMMPANYGNSYRIVQGPGVVAISYEMVHETRIIPLSSGAGSAPADAPSRDDGPMLGAAIRQYMGVSRGRWDGHTLVVETTNFRDEPVYRGSNPAVLRLVERFTPVAPDRLEWSVTVDDPSTWPRPWTFAMPLTRNDEEAIFEYACHEGNRAMANLLSAARAEEKAGRASAAAVASTPEAPLRTSAPAADPSFPLSGEWVLPAGVARGNFAGYSTPSRLAIRESAAEVVIESDTGTAGQMQRVTYRLDGDEVVVPGPLGWDTRARARRENGAVRVDIVRSIDGPDGTMTFAITDVYRAEAGRLTLERSQGTRSRQTAYERPVAR